MDTKKAVIFDLDGVIVDTAVFHYQGWKRLADELNVPFDVQANEKLRGVPRRESLLALLGYNPGEEKIKEYTDRKNQYYLELVSTLKPGNLLPGAGELLKGLRQAGFKVALASSSKNAKLVLGKIGIAAAFDAIVDGNEIIHGKPAPELFIKAGWKLNVEPVNCLVVEDAESGIEAGIAAGMHTLGVGNPASLSRAERVVSSLAEIDVEGVRELTTGLPTSGRGDRPSAAA